MPDSNSGFLVTKDLQMTAALMCAGFAVAGIDVQKEGSGDRRIGYFRLAETPELKEAVASYKAFRMQVEPHQLAANVRDLKSSVVSSERAPGR